MLCDAFPVLLFRTLSPHSCSIAAVAQCTQRESNPHFRHGKPAGFRYIMGANVLIELSKNGREKRKGGESRAETAGEARHSVLRVSGFLLSTHSALLLSGGFAASGSGGARIHVSRSSAWRYTVSATDPNEFHESQVLDEKSPMSL